MLNYDGKVGAVGRIPHYMRNLMSPAWRSVIRRRRRSAGPRRPMVSASNVGTARWARRSAGSRDEPGSRGSTAIPTATDTEQKILRDVFAQGDAWFRTGDLMRMDAPAISISSIASATRSAGRARTSRRRSRRRDHGRCRRPRSQCLWRARAGHRRARRHGRDRDRRCVGPRRLSRPPGATAAALRAAEIPARRRPHRHHLDFQTH